MAFANSFCWCFVIVHSILNSWARRESNPLIPFSCPTFVDFWPLSTTYHNTQAVLTIRCAVASAFVGYCFRDSSPTTRKVDCITIHYTLLPVLFVPIHSATIRTLLLFACYSSPTSWLVRGRTRYKVYSIRGRTIHPRLSLFHAPARLSYCHSRQFIHMDYSFSSL